MGLFSVDGFLYRFISRFWDLVKLNFFWLICCIPLFTIGPATVAASFVMLKMVEDKEGYVIKTYFLAFKENFKIKNIVMGLIFIIALYSLYLDYQFFYAVPDMSTTFLIVGVVAAFVIFLSFVYAFPLMARYENGMIATIKNSHNIAVRFFLRTMFMLVVIAVETLLFLWNEVLVIVGLLVGPACILYTICGFAIRFFHEIEKEPGAVTNPDKLDEI